MSACYFESSHVGNCENNISYPAVLSVLNILNISLFPIFVTIHFLTLLLRNFVARSAKMCLIQSGTETHGN